MLKGWIANTFGCYNVSKFTELDVIE